MDLGKALKPDPTKKPVATWTVEDVGIWVSDINNGDLANYAELFKSKVSGLTEVTCSPFSLGHQWRKIVST